MEVIRGCEVEGSYRYYGFTHKRESVRISDADELYARLPVGAAALEGKLARSGQLNVDMSIVGRLESEAVQFGEDALSGVCGEATHVVTGVTLGAFSMYTGRSLQGSGGVAVGPAGAGGGATRSREVLREDGDGQTCIIASTSDDAPPEGCAAPLRVEVVAIESSVAAAVIPEQPAIEASNSSPVVDRSPPKSRELKVAQALGYGGLALAALAATGGGVALARRNARNDQLQSSNPAELAEVGDEREEAIRGAQTSQALMWAGFGAAAAFLAVGVVFTVRAAKLKRESKTLSYMPLQSGGGMALGGRFAP